MEAGLPVGSLDMVLATRPGLALLWWSEEDLLLETEDEPGLVAAEDEVMLGLDGGLLVLLLVPLLPVLLVLLGLTVLLFSLRWLLYELRLGSL